MTSPSGSQPKPSGNGGGAERRGEGGDVSEPFTSLARAQGIHVLIDLNAQNIPWLFTGIAVQHGAITSRRDDFKKFLRATIEGNYLAFSNPRLAKETLAKELKVGIRGHSRSLTMTISIRHR